MHHSLQIMFILPLMTGHLFWKATILGGLYRGVPLYLNLSCRPEMPNSGQNWQFFALRDLENWRMTLKNNRAPLLCCFKLCASFHSHWFIRTGVTVRNPPIWFKISDFLSRVTLKFDGWPKKNNRAPVICYFKHCASFHRNMWIQTGVMVRKQLNGVMTLTLDLWPWHFAWTSRQSWKFQDVTMRGTLSKTCDRQMDRRTDGRK